MAHVSEIHEHMRVKGSCGNQLGVVDRLEGDSIKLTKRDSPDGKHHYIPASWVTEVEGETVILDRDCGKAKQEWRY
jgi:hypothetical protein